jgi:hypothetical protein
LAISLSPDFKPFGNFLENLIAVSLRARVDRQCWIGIPAGNLEREVEVSDFRAGIGGSKSKRAKARMAARVMLLSGAAVVVCAAPGFAACSGKPQHVAGGALTDFIDPSHTDGVAIGDLRGAIGVEILATLSNGFHVHHHFVAESGDQIFFADADVTVFPTSDPNRVVADYLKGVNITGGTGRFDKASET